MTKEKEERQDVIFISKSRRHSIGNYKPEELYANGKLKKGEQMIVFDDWGYTIAASDPEYQKKIDHIEKNSAGDVRRGTQAELNKVRLARLPIIREMATAGKEEVPGMATVETVALSPEEAMKDND